MKIDQFWNFRKGRSPVKVGLVFEFLKGQVACENILVSEMRDHL
jgi:hypothetical protein